MVILSTLRFVIKRAFHHRAILLPVLLGVLAAVTILCSVPLFSTAASNVGLRATLDAPAQAVDKNLRIDFTIEDPKVFSRPWKMRMPLYRRMEQNAQLQEYNCVEFTEQLLYGHLVKQPNK